jgi:uncharacterized membrane protein
MTVPTGDAPAPPRGGLATLVEHVERLWRRANRYVRSQLVWNNVFRTTSYLRSALWIVPLLSILLVLTLVPILRWLDAWLGWRIAGLTVTGAQSLYQSVITLTLSFMVFTFGSLLVAIQVASGQLTPRIIATTLLRDNVVRYSVGLFAFTLIFAIMALNRLETSVHELVSVVVALLGIACMVNFLFFIDYAARLLRPVSILARVAEEGIAVIRSIYPTPAGDSPDVGEAPDLPTERRRVVDHQGTSAMVLAVDLQTLLREAIRRGGIIEFVPHVGDFVASEEPLFALYGGAVAVDDTRLRAAVAFGSERTLEQDPLFAFRIMVDIGLKALSPAINDPTTAVLALDQIHRLLKAVGRRHLRGETLLDRRGRVRVIFRTPNWEDFVQLSCHEIRMCGANNVQIARRLRAMLDNLIDSLPEHRHPPLEAERQRLAESIAAIYRLPGDLALAQIPDSQGLGGASRPLKPL